MAKADKLDNDDAPRYRVTEQSYIGNTLVEENGEVVYDGIPGSNLQPLNKAAEDAKRAARTGQPSGGRGVARVQRTRPADEPAEETTAADDGSDLAG